ncbi:NAD(P)/FAD-dependent oxidoreductase [Leptolyngbya sp. FACHB-671]|uniref:NAD(P)/FAD-dependent oxidoreductase n=1 Tax=Leptolyngbya sp. FACHB-671 TaxID=2692812 RepID=UPI0016824C3E|nr:NAD(P)/FAD-dependent oxidoreductase [Leptolyngbya sp. FACHB-671]MBD2071403.1 NAD(P)/FAD-dependent oxidoreductase [Leptolyngbya sp. FACHB-671]
MSTQKRPRIVIIGGGFGGLSAVQSVASSAVEVLLIDRNNYHTFSPMLYQVATAELGAEQIAYPIRNILRKLPNTQFLQAEVKRIDFAQRAVETDRTVIFYDFLILATGSVTQILSVPGAAEYAFRLDNLRQAIALRNHILRCFEQAAYESNPERRRQRLTFTIIGGGPTGIELAGALVELLGNSLKRDYPVLDFRQVKVLLVQSGSRLLRDMPERSQRYTQRQLQKMGVKVILDAKVNRITSGAVHLQDGRIILTESPIWTAGVQANSLLRQWGLPMGDKGKVTVLPTLQVPDHLEVYGVGDLALLKESGQPLPMVAPAAIQQGRAAAKNIRRQLIGRQPVPFKYWNKGAIAMIGRNAAAAQIGKFVFTGFPAWLLWLGVHLVYLPGFRNRLQVLIDWLWDYVLRDRPARFVSPTSRAIAETYPTPDHKSDEVRQIYNRQRV